MKTVPLLPRFFLFVLPALLLISGCSEPTLGEKGAIPIVEKNVSARGGLEAWRAVKSITLSGQMDAGKLRSPQGIKTALESANAKAKRKANNPQSNVDSQDGKVVQLPFVMEQERPRKLRVELNFQGQTAVQVYDGEQGWKLRPFLGRHEVETYTPAELKLASNEQELDGPLIDYARKGNRVEFEGSEKVDDKDTYKLKVTLPNSEVRHVWLDQENYLEVKIDGTRKLDGKQRPMETYFRDYKNVNGLQIPHLLETKIEGINRSERIIIEKVALNAAIDEGHFEKPQ